MFEHGTRLRMVRVASATDQAKVWRVVGPLPDNDWGMLVLVGPNGELIVRSQDTLSSCWELVTDMPALPDRVLVSSLNVYENWSNEYHGPDAAEWADQQAMHDRRIRRVDTFSNGDVAVTTYAHRSREGV